MENTADPGDRLSVLYGHGYTAIFDVIHRGLRFNDVIQIQFKEIIMPSGNRIFNIEEVVYRWTAGSKFPKGWEIQRARFDPKKISQSVTRRIIATQVWENDDCLGNVSPQDLDCTPRMNVDGFRYIVEWLCLNYSRKMA